MARKKESVFRARLDFRLKEIPRSWFTSIQQIVLVGVPDKLGVVNGYFVGLELKKDSKSKPSKIQAYILRKIRSAGGYAAVVFPENADKVISELMELTKGKSPDQLQEGILYE